MTSYRDHDTPTLSARRSLAASERGRTWAEVDLNALARNLHVLKEHIGPDQLILAVVKADAYGHGAVNVARCLQAEGVEMLGVATPEEGLGLRRAGLDVPILVLGPVPAHWMSLMAETALTPTAFGPSSLDAILEAGNRPGRPLSFHLKVDTGMGRLGFLPDQMPAALERIASTPGKAVLEGLFTHLSCSDDPADPFTRAQLSAFSAVLRRVRAAGFSPRYIHAANSGGILDHPDAHCNMVRPGLLLHGIHPAPSSSRLDLSPTLAFKTRLALIKRLPAGSPLGYGRSFITVRPSLIGTVLAGYADGLNRLLGRRGHALVRGAQAPYVGRISMDFAMIDLTDIPRADEGDEVVLLGRQGNEEVHATQFAAWAETIPYEALCSIGSRVPRIYRWAGAERGTL